MNLRQKTLLVMVIINLSVISLAVIGVQSYLNPVLSQDEKFYAQAMLQDASKTLNDEIYYLNITSDDYAVWDQSYKFVQSNNPSYIKTTLSNPILTRLRVDFMLFYNKEGNLLYGKYLSAPGQEEIIDRNSNTTQQLEYYLRTIKNQSQKTSGFLLVEDKPVIIVSRPILPSNGEGEPGGTLYVGKFLDKDELETIFNSSGEMVTLLPYNSSKLPPNFQKAKDGLNKGEKYFYTIDGNKMGAYTLINSVNNTPILLLQAEVPRVYSEFQTSVFYYIILLLLMGILNGMVIIYYLDWKIINRLVDMSRQVLKMGEDNDLSNRLPLYGNDELGDLGSSINQMLNSMEKSDAQIKTSLKEKEVLLREIHHRTKNNLQIIATLLEMQSDEANDSRLNEFYRESQNRIHAMALVHENLYMTTNLTGIELDSYLTSLVEDLMYSYKRRNFKINVEMKVQPIKLNLESAIPCGLIVTELVSNALKHAFPGLSKGKISIYGDKDDDETITIKIRDNGVGLPENITLENPRGLGLQLVETFVEQLEGNIQIECDGGTTFIIRFKELHYRERM